MTPIQEIKNLEQIICCKWLGYSIQLQSCVVQGLVWYEYTIIWGCSYNFSVHIHIIMRDWVIYKFTKEIILNLLIESDTGYYVITEASRYTTVWFG